MHFKMLTAGMLQEPDLKKAMQRGGFWRRYVLQEVIEDESVTKSKWCSHTPSNTLYLEEE